MKVEMPIVGKFLDAPLHQIHGEIGTTRAGGRLLSKKHRAKNVSRFQLGIERHGYVEQRPEQVVLLGAGNVVGAEVLDSARPVNVGKQSRVPQAHSLYG